MLLNERGQSLIELVVVVAVIVIIVGALVFATIASLRNSDLAKNQAQATKLAQEGLEKVRSLRDRNGTVLYHWNNTMNVNDVTSNFNDLWQYNLSAVNFFFKSNGDLTDGVTTESILPYFKRQIMIADEGDGKTQKRITAVVSWSDYAGTHESRLTTILRNTSNP